MLFSSVHQGGRAQSVFNGRWERLKGVGGSTDPWVTGGERLPELGGRAGLAGRTTGGEESIDVGEPLQGVLSKGKAVGGNLRRGEGI